MKKALIIGLGQSGRAAADVLLLEGYQVFAADAFHETLSLQQWFSLQDPSKVHKLQDRPVEDIASYALAIVSPGIAKDHPLYKQVREAGIPCQGEAEFALQKLHQKSIGITGSNGKTT
ncbi:MAG: UDP-N-acetylmuramoylalanine--D-glutamate ligase, partial [Chlamydiae bacterium]|nr:UDP-N-acetylmuramoylalanine--D-glutamate ligase [Chlamydiota bacterium]